MQCKNCDSTLRTDYSYCPDCGAKVIRNRLTIKNLWYDATERFFNLDNTFVVTFKHLLSKPDKVIVGYINGVRKKYLNPISYFTIAVTIGGLFIFLNIKFFPDALDYQIQQMEASSLDESGKFTVDFVKKYQATVRDYQNLFYILALPFLALISRLVFINRKQFNLSEHFVINIYAYSQTSIIVNAIHILAIWNSRLIYYIASVEIIPMVLYFTYVYKKVFNLTLKQTIIKLLFFLLIFGILFIGLIFAVVLYLVFFTDTFQKMQPL